MTELAGSDPLIFPLGHYLGAGRSSAGSEPDFHVVRVGWRTHTLDDPQQLAVWGLAHGMAMGSDDELTWTRNTLEGAARVTGIAQPGVAVRNLLDRDLLLEATPEGPDAVDFARACRLRSLLVGTGNTADDPLSFGVTVSEAVPSAAVDGFTYELWKWGHACDNIWHACQILAAAGDADDRDQTNPIRVLERVLRSIRRLLAIGAAYLDEAREDSPEPSISRR